MTVDKGFMDVAAACLVNAKELVKGSAALHSQGLSRLAFHLALLSLEEVGKASMLAMRRIAARRGDTSASTVGGALDDHVRKLFWAIWGPSFTQEVITREQIEETIGLAKRLHERRLRGLYVDATESGVSSPMEVISTEETEHIIKFAEACIELAPNYEEGLVEIESEAIARQEWFLQATDDPARRRTIFGSTSLAKLKELGDVREWVSWLKDTFEKAEAEAKTAVDRELARPLDEPAHAKPKWRMTVRLRTLSHSVRQKPLNEVNNGLAWLKLRAVSGKRDQLLIDLTSTSNLSFEDAYKSDLALARRVAMALNVATLGVFWFQDPLDADEKHSGRFFESFVDLETKREMAVHRNPPLRMQLGPRRMLLDKAALDRWTLCVVRMLQYREPSEAAICERYLEGLAMMHRTDVHMSFEIQAVVAFYLALKTAMQHHGDWRDGEYPEALRRCMTESVSKKDEPHLQRLIDVGESVSTGRGVPHAMNMNDVGVMKALCDVYLLRTYQRLGISDLRDPGDAPIP